MYARLFGIKMDTEPSLRTSISSSDVRGRQACVVGNLLIERTTMENNDGYRDQSSEVKFYDKK